MEKLRRGNAAEKGCSILRRAAVHALIAARTLPLPVSSASFFLLACSALIRSNTARSRGNRWKAGTVARLGPITTGRATEH